MWRKLRHAGGAVLCLATLTRVAVAAAPDTSGFIFVASPSDPEIAVIDSTTDIVVHRLRLPAAPRQVAVLDRGARLVVSDGVARKLSVIDAKSGVIEREMATTVAPIMLQVERTGTVLAVGDPVAGAVELIQLSKASTVMASGLQGLQSIAFDVGGYLLAAHDHKLAVLDTQTGRMVTEFVIEEGNGPVTHVATDPGGDYAFVLQADRGILSVFNLKKLTKAAHLVLPLPLGGALPSADSQFMLVPIAGGRALAVVSTWTLKESGRIPMAAPVSAVGLGLFQSVSIGMSRASQSVQAADLRDRRSLGILRLPGVPEAGASSPDGVKFYVALNDTGQVAVLDLLHTTVGLLIDTAVRGAATVIPAVGNNYCH